MKVILDVPYYSQFKVVENMELQNKACSLVCLKMAIEYYFPDRGQVSAIDLFDESEIIQKSMLEKGLITEKVVAHGRSHDTIVFVAHNHGLSAYREEFRSISVNLETHEFLPNSYDEYFWARGIEKIKTAIKNNSLVMTSVFPGLSDGKSFHTLLIIGFEESEDGELKGFYYHDSDAVGEPKNAQFIDLPTFKKFWRRLAIFLG
ncbi:MAG TPA: C39 family peptidase [Candidatus Paceibacterota bacterium]